MADKKDKAALVRLWKQNGQVMRQQKWNSYYCGVAQHSVCECQTGFVRNSG